MRERLLSDLAADGGAVMPESGADGPPLVALPIHRHMIADGHAASPDGANASINRMSNGRCRAGRLRGLGFRLKLKMLGVMRLQGGDEDRQLLAGFQPPEALGGFDHAGGGPSERHAGVTPAFGVAADAADGSVYVFDDVGAGERASEFQRQTEPRDGEDLVDTFQDAGGDARRLAFEPASEVPDQLLGLVGVVQLPGLAQRLPDRTMEVLGQALDDVTGLVNLAALDRRVAAERLPDCLGERLGAVNDEE